MHDERVRYIRNERNIGAINNFKRALQEASSEYFMWLAADDYLEQDAIDTMMRCMGEGHGFVFPAFRLVSDVYGNSDGERFRCFWWVSVEDWKSRVVRFYNMHPLSIRDMLVYSLFDRNFLSRHVVDLNDDIYLFCAKVLRASAGGFPEKVTMSKVYAKRWPGQRRKGLVRSILGGRKERIFHDNMSGIIAVAVENFPEVASELELIGREVDPFRYGKCFSIVEDLNWMQDGRSVQDG